MDLSAVEEQVLTRRVESPLRAGRAQGADKGRAAAISPE